MGAEELGKVFQGGTLQPLPPNATKEQQTAVINDILVRINSLLQTQVTSDGTDKRYLNGYQKGGWPGGDFGMKISLPGVDVTTASASELLFSWDYTTNTQVFYDPDDPGRDVGQQGILPNGKSGNAWAKDGESVSGAFS